MSDHIESPRRALVDGPEMSGFKSKPQVLEMLNTHQSVCFYARIELSGDVTSTYYTHTYTQTLSKRCLLGSVITTVTADILVFAHKCYCCAEWKCT